MEENHLHAIDTSSTAGQNYSSWHVPDSSAKTKYDFKAIAGSCGAEILEKKGKMIVSRDWLRLVSLLW